MTIPARRKTPRFFPASALALSCALLLAACGGGGGDGDTTPDTGDVTKRIYVLSADAGQAGAVAAGQTLSVTLTGVEPGVNWYSDRPTREDQVEHEQPACLHAGMDVYKWCFKLAPAVPSELTLDAFRHALRVRRLDMQASPYDVSGLGLDPVAIETGEGKAEYVARQRELMVTSNSLRRRLLEVIEALTTAFP